MGNAFPTLKQNPEDVRAIIKEEEAQFGRTLDRGIKQFLVGQVGKLERTNVF